MVLGLTPPLAYRTTSGLGDVVFGSPWGAYRIQIGDLVNG